MKTKRASREDEERAAQATGPTGRAAVELRRVARDRFGDNVFTRGAIDYSPKRKHR